MAGKDYRHREQKKPKKDAKKVLNPINVEPAPPPVEVIRRGKKERLGEE